jgi:hypothetical protein
VNTLIATMSDVLISLHWRKTCYRYVKSLNPLLFEIMDQREYQQKTQEINTLHDYFILTALGQSHQAEASDKTTSGK